MKKIGIITTSLLLTASLLFYSSSSNLESSQGQVRSQQWVIEGIPFKREVQNWIRPLLARVRTLILPL